MLLYTVGNSCVDRAFPFLEKNEETLQTQLWSMPLVSEWFLGLQLWVSLKVASPCNCDFQEQQASSSLLIKHFVFFVFLFCNFANKGLLKQLDRIMLSKCLDLSYILKFNRSLQGTGSVCFF